MRIFFLICGLFCVFNTGYASISYGNSKGNIIIDEYVDYNCPVCRAMMPVISALAHQNTMLEVNIKVVPILAPSSRLIDSAIIASMFQGKFAPMQKRVLSLGNRELLTISQIIHIGEDLALNKNQWQQDLSSPILAKELQKNIDEYQKFHQNKVPLLVLYKRNHPQGTKVLIGQQSIATLKQAISALH